MIQTLVKNGQIDIVHGGMVSSDEACPNYNDMIRNFEMGHNWLWEEFGVTPTIGWQLDPFGHSAANAHIFAELGFDAFVFTRINEDEQKNRKLERDEQFVWRPEFQFSKTSALKDSQRDIFAHLTSDGYGLPDIIPINWYKNEWAGPIKPAKPYDGMSKKLIDFAKRQASTRRTNNVLMTWGQDFANYDALSLDNLNTVIDELRNYAEQENLDVQFKWSTVQGYFDDVYSEAKSRKDVEFDIEGGDFWGYNLHSVPGAYWTGYYTTYPEIKNEMYQFGDFV